MGVLFKSGGIHPILRTWQPIPCKAVSDQTANYRESIEMYHCLRSSFMHKLFLSLFATVLASTFAVAAEGDSAAPPIAEQAIPSAYVWFSGGSFALGIGFSWGHGTLYYSKDQKQYKFNLSGVSIADVGGAGITAEGEVYNLSRPADLSGHYTAVTAGVTVIEGGSVAYLKNDNGVVIKLHSQTGGLRFNLAANGMNITLQQS
jgi:hypothetical protein